MPKNLNIMKMPKKIYVLKCDLAGKKLAISFIFQSLDHKEVYRTQDFGSRSKIYNQVTLGMEVHGHRHAKLIYYQASAPLIFWDILSKHCYRSRTIYY